MPPIRLFISYRSLDSAKVDTLVQILQSLKNADDSPRYDVWQDKFGIAPGHDWWESIVDAIIACDVFVFMVSHESVQNINCRAELNYARRRNRPVLPVVLDGEFARNPVTGKDDIDFWADVPTDLTDGRLQFLFYVEQTFEQQLQIALATITPDAVQQQDVRVARPPDPRLAADANSDSIALYGQASDFALRGELDAAEHLFRRLMNARDSGFNQEAREWVELLVQYDELLRLNAQETTRYRVKEAWPDYVKRFPLRFIEFFDPKDIQASLIDPRAAYVPPQTPKNTAPSPTQRQSTNTKAPNRTLLPIVSGVAVVIVLVIAMGGFVSGVFNRPSSTATVTPAPMVVIAPSNVPSAIPLTPSNTAIGVTPSSNTPKPHVTDAPNMPLTASDMPPGERTDSNGIKQVYVPVGCFMMGSDLSKDSKANKDEQPQHQVCITQPYWLDEFDVTNAAFDAFDKAGGYSNDSLWSVDGLSWKQSKNITGPDTSCMTYSSEPNQPRVCVNYYEAEAYAKWRGGRLPSEAEWEYAARGATGWIYPWGDTFDQSKANTTENNIGKTTAVDANESGISWVGAYDMAGNVFQWVRDWYGSDYYSSSPTNDPTGPSTGQYRELRGGSFYYDQFFARSTFRNSDLPFTRVSYFGFRVVYSGFGQ